MNFSLATVEEFLKKNLTKILTYTLIAEALILLLASTKHIFSPDEIEFLRSGWFLSQGQRIYSGFLENHNPLYFYVIAPFFQLFTDPLNACIAIRLITCSFYLFTLWGVFNTCSLLWNKETALFASCLSPAWFMTSRIVFETRPDITQVTCTIWCVYFLIKSIKEKNASYSFVSGIFFGLAFLFLQKIALLYPLLICVLIMENFLNRKILALLPYLIAGTVSALAPYYWYLWQTNQLTLYWQLCYIFNQIDQKKTLFQILSPRYFLNFLFAATVYTDRIIWSFSILGLLTTKSMRPLLPIFAGLLIGTFWSGVYSMSGPQYHLLYAPFASIIAGAGFSYLRKKDILTTILLFYFCLYPLHFHVCTLIFPKSTNLSQLQEARYCSTVLQKEESVAVGNYHLLFYNDSHPIWYLYPRLKPTYEKSTGKSLHTWVEGIKNVQPIFISKKVASYDNLETTGFFKEHYTECSTYPSLYIRKDKTEKL